MIGRIPHHIVPTALVQDRLSSIFPDSVILNNQFKLISVSQNVLLATGFTREHLINHSINMFSRTTNLEHLLLEKLKMGYFSDELVEVHGRNGNSLFYSVSGFRMGLISDYNGLIILRFKKQEDLHSMHDTLEMKTSDIDRFVYVSAHSLRGPLATMKGLINLAKTYSDTKELRFLIDQMDVFAERLDNHLHKLIYFAECDKGYEASSKRVPLYYVVKSLNVAIVDSPLYHNVNFRCIATDLSLLLDNGEVLLSLLRNLVIFFCQQNKSDENELQLDVHSSKHNIELVLTGTGFSPIDLLKAKLSALNFSYSEILDYPELINYYAAKKIIFKLRGNMQFMIKADQQMTAMIIIPKNTHLH